MISYLKGNILRKDAKGIILLVGGVGYKVLIGNNFLEKIKEGSEIELFIYFQQREDSVNLYGFVGKGELDLFNELISISGVGPRTGLHLIDSLGVKEIQKAIGGKRADILAKTPGLGKKTAERILVEMKNKYLAFASDGEAMEITDEETDVVNALVGLGYAAGDVRSIIRQIPEGINGTDNKIKEALKIIGRNK